MAETSPELQVKLQELEQEFEDGEITAKGYQKRRTLLFNQYMGDEIQQQGQASQAGGLRLHNPDDSAHPASSELDLAGHMGSQPAQWSASGGSMRSSYDTANNGYGGGYEPGRLQIRNVI